jgi:hypothetical protein
MIVNYRMDVTVRTFILMVTLGKYVLKDMYFYI